MSLINKMLQELDKRHAPQVGQAATSPLAANVRPVKAARVGSEFFWWVLAAIMLLAIAWLGWVMWQLTPRPVVNELALRTSSRAVAGVPALSTQAAPAEESQSASVPLPDVPVQLSSPAPVVNERPVAPVAIVPLPRLDALKLATEITTPIQARTSRAPTPAAKPAVQANAAAANAAAANSAAANAATAKPAAPQSAGKSEAQATTKALTAARTAPVNPVAAAAANDGRIDKRVSASTRERAETEYRRAIGLINQGRMSEGMDGLRSALNLDASYDAARQTLVALLVEQRRFDDAVLVLQRGLDIDPARTDFAMLLARILVDRQEVSGALTVLRKHEPAAGGNADYHAFIAALQQRLGNHKEAIEEYQLALRLSPQAGMWWMGLGISQEASGRKKEAAEAFRQARSSGNLGSDLLAYVDQRLRQLQ